MAGVVASYIGSDGKRYFLTGKESVYLTDSMQTVTLGGQERSIADDLQKAKPSVTTENQAKTDFENRARGISKVIGQRVQFAQPVKDTASGLWTTTYRILPVDFKYGIPKGRTEGSEDPLQTATRELKEEVGFTLKGLAPFPVPGIDRVIFRVDINPKDIPGIQTIIDGRMARHYGELFDVGFRTAAQMGERMNSVTRRSLEQVGGKRRRRRTNRRSRRRITRRT